MVEINAKYPFVHLRRKIEASYGKGYKTEESEVGVVSTSRRWTARLPHPTNMSKYDDWANDAEASIAINVLTDIIARVGYYTEMGEEVPEEQRETHKHKKKIDEYGEAINLDEKMAQIEMEKLQKGFCPVERLEDYDLKILPPETFYIYRDKLGNVLKYQQERSVNEVIATWEGDDINDIILFFHRRTTSWPYGKSLVEPIGPLIAERDQMNEDMPKAVHRWAYPIPVMRTSRDKSNLQKAFEDRDIDDWVFIGNVNPDEFGMETLAIDPQARFIPYIELIYYQICEGLHAPLLLYLKSATEASATVMMESVDRLVGGEQRYNKRRMERYFFEPQVGNPTPRVVWGQPKTGLEEISGTDIAALLPHLAPNQQQDLLKQFGIQLPEPEWPKQPVLPTQQPFQKPQPQIPVEQMLDKLNDMNTALNIIETNKQEGKINLIKAMQLGGKTIEVFLSRTYGKDSAVYVEKRDMEFEQWTRRLIGAKKGKPSYHVTVED